MAAYLLVSMKPMMSRIQRAMLCSVLAAIFSWPLHAAETQVDMNLVLREGMTAYQAKDYVTAIERLSQIVAASPDGAIQNVVYTLGFAQFFNLQHEEAAKTFDLFLKKYPQANTAAEVHLTRANALLKLEGKEQEALTHLAEASKKPEFAEEARFLAVEAYLKLGDKERAGQTLESTMKEFATGPVVLRAALQLVDLHISSGDLDEALKILNRLEDSSGYPDIIVTVNHRLVQIGDQYVDLSDFPAALASYSSVRPRNQVVAIQTNRLESTRKMIAELERRVAAAERTKQVLPRGLADRLAQLKALSEHTEKVLGDVRTRSDYDAIVQFRIARCYFNMERYWPAAVAFEAVADDHKDFSDAPTSLFGAIVSYFRLNMFGEADALSQRYLRDFAKEKHADQVVEMRATLLLQDGKAAEAVSFIDPWLQANPQSPTRERLLMLLANARFQSGQYDAAAKSYDQLRKEFAASPAYEEIVYRRALCDFLRNDYEATLKSFSAYEKDFPKGQFLADISYRRGIIQLAMKQYDTLIASMNQLLKNPAAQNNAGQIHTLLGDAWSAKGDVTQAADAFTAAVRTANGDVTVLQYALEQATSMLSGSRRWQDLRSLLGDFLKDNPNHPMELRTVAELVKLFHRDKQTVQAKEMLMKYAMRDIHNPRSEYVEMLLSQLAGLYVPPRTAKKDESAPSLDALLEALTKQLEIPEASRTLTSFARVEFAKAELARMMRDADRQGRILNTIATVAKPQDLGPILLSLVGQFLVNDGKPDQAAPLFVHLRDQFRDSAYSDAASVGLGQIALNQKDFAAAVVEYDQALNRSAGNSMLKEAMFGKAQALQGLKKWDDAKKLYEEIVATREWRGAEKAGSVFHLGEIAAEQGDLGAANAHFQKVYLSYGAFPQYAAKAYLMSAEMLEKAGQPDAAATALRKLLDHPKLKDSAEAEIARKKLES